MGTYSWRVGAYQNQGNASPPGYAGTPFSPGAVGAPSGSSELIRVGLSMYYEVAGTNPSVSITPDWPWAQTAEIVAAAQAAGDATVPSPSDPSPVDQKCYAFCVTTPWSFGFATSQGIAAMQTGGMVWSKGADRTPPGGGLQVRPAFALNDGSGLIGLFGSSFRWRYTVRCRVLWYTP